MASQSAQSELGTPSVASPSARARLGRTFSLRPTSADHPAHAAKEVGHAVERFSLRPGETPIYEFPKSPMPPIPGWSTKMDGTNIVKMALHPREPVSCLLGSFFPLDIESFVNAPRPVVGVLRVVSKYTSVIVCVKGEGEGVQQKCPCVPRVKGDAGRA